MARATKGQRRAAAGAGVAAAVLGAGLGELTAAIVAPGASPFAVIGAALIDFAPTWAKDAAIALFGTNDKIALLVGIGIVLVGVAAVAGLVELKWPPFGLAIMVVFGGVGVLAAITRANAGPLDWVPSVVAGVTAAVALGLLMARLPGRSQRAVTYTRNPDAAPEAPQPPAPPVERRTFLVWAVGTAAVGVLAAVGVVARAGRHRSGERRPRCAEAAGGGDAGGGDSRRRPSSASRAWHP